MKLKRKYKSTNKTRKRDNVVACRAQERTAMLKSNRVMPVSLFTFL